MIKATLWKVSKDTFHNEMILKVSLKETFHNFKNIRFILKVSLEEIISTIFIYSRKFRIYVEERHL